MLHKLHVHVKQYRGTEVAYIWTLNLRDNIVTLVQSYNCVEILHFKFYILIIYIYKYLYIYIYILINLSLEHNSEPKHFHKINNNYAAQYMGC